MLALSATGCVVYAEDRYEDAATISAEWSFENIATNTRTDCPAGFDTVRMISQPVDRDLRPLGEPFVDLFDCRDGRHASELLPPDVYQVWLEIVSNGGESLYAQSTSAIVDVIDRDALFSATILDDGGYFLFDWTLRGETSNATLSCAGTDSIEILSTLSGTTEARSDKFNCDDGSALTAGLLAGSYTVSVSALDRSDRALGTAPTLTSKAIRDRNQVTDLGLITIPIANQ
ncbi:MAG: hypothetical protein H0T89_19950 [Deltaproteobacteria bacterium]|nr:hypothetical protein [Deltaproteobacteria bacterium]MDQ3297109.1 hypothetical protein [Myxococcota bacterium]